MRFEGGKAGVQCQRRAFRERQRLVLGRMLDGVEGQMNTSKYAKLAKCSTDTALHDMRDLQDRGILVRTPGGWRSTSWRLANADDLERLRA